MKPNISVETVNTVNRLELQQGVKVTLRSNSAGFRTPEVRGRKEKDVYRIIMLGDSTTFGWGVNQEESYSRILEKKLNLHSKKRRYEVVNFGIPGYTSFHGKAVFNHFALDLDPDMVVVTFGANDSKRISSATKQVLTQEGWLVRLKYFFWNFKTYKLLRKMILSLSNPLDRLRNKKSVEGEKQPFSTLNEFRENLDYIVVTCKKKNIDVVFLSLCCPIDYLAKMSALAKARGVAMVDGMYLLIRQIPAVRKGELYPGLIEYYRQLYGEKILQQRRLLYVTNDTCHPNRIGHQIIADYLYKHIFEGGITGKFSN
jgi:lysophospholipase L1-like esterase